ncbi:MAG: glycosyltransferase family 4 protein [Solirubrobacteraceae bacterium]
MTVHLLDALAQLDALAGHVDTRDPRPVATIGRLDAQNVWLGLRHTGQLWRLLRRDREAAVHISISQGRWGLLRDALLVLVARLERRALYVQLHGGGLSDFYASSSGFVRWLVRVVLAQADQAWALTPGLRAQFDGLVAPQRVCCVPNVVEDPGSRSRRARRTAGKLRILFVGNLLPEKGCLEVVRAIRLLGEVSRDWEVRVVGAGSPDVERCLRGEIAALPAHAAHVHALGSLTGDAKLRQYEWADVFVYPTRYPAEGQPLVLLEALGAGLPIVTTRWAGIPETVLDQRVGLLVDPGDERALASALRRLAEDPELRERLGAAARSHYESRFRPERLLRDLESVLKEA